MEKLYRDGKHFRGDDFWKVPAKHKITGEEREFEANGETAADVRAAVRRLLKDEARPYQWDLRSARAVRGLGRDWQWSSLNLVQLEG